MCILALSLKMMWQTKLLIDAQSPSSPFFVKYCEAQQLPCDHGWACLHAFASLIYKCLIVWNSYQFVFAFKMHQCVLKWKNKRCFSHIPVATTTLSGEPHLSAQRLRDGLVAGQDVHQKCRFHAKSVSLSLHEHSLFGRSLYCRHSPQLPCDSSPLQGIITQLQSQSWHFFCWYFEK